MGRARILSVVAAVAGFAAGLGGAEVAFGRLRTTAPKPSAPLLYSVELRDSTGSLLASPLVVGREGDRISLSLSQPPGGPRGPSQRRGGSDQPGVQMSIELDPQRTGEQAICLGYKLSVSGDPAPHQGRVGITYGERRVVKLEGAERYTLELTVAPAGSQHFSRMLRARARPLI